MENTFLVPEHDGLIMRGSGDYARDKLKIVQAYIYMFTTSMRKKDWRALHYIDLQAGPGKNVFDKGLPSVMLGSPLIALTTKTPFDRYWFVEQGVSEFSALKQRVTTSNQRDRIHLLNDDCNVAVDSIVNEIREIDSEALSKWPSLNLAFLDPEGLELEWETVSKLAQVKRMDLIINFSTNGFTRNANQLLPADETRIDRFFGTHRWRDEYLSVANQGNTHVRRKMIDFYISRLKEFNYEISDDSQIVEKVFKTSRNRQLYTLIFASKNALGNKFWKKVIDLIEPPRLF